jgi:hypothetical protein
LSCGTAQVDNTAEFYYHSIKGVFIAVGGTAGNAAVCLMSGRKLKIMIFQGLSIGWQE